MCIIQNALNDVQVEWHAASYHLGILNKQYGRSVRYMAGILDREKGNWRQAFAITR